jgi:hypothetical protein
MATNVHTLHSARSVDDGASEPSFLDSWFTRFIEARIAAGERRAQQHVKFLSPDILASLGLTPAQIAEVQATGKLPASYRTR